jgi:hypothetical protein
MPRLDQQKGLVNRDLHNKPRKIRRKREEEGNGSGSLLRNIT